MESGRVLLGGKEGFGYGLRGCIRCLVLRGARGYVGIESSGIVSRCRVRGEGNLH